MTATTLQRLTGGRFTLGLGASTAALVEGFHDQRFVGPAARLERYVSQVRALLNGERLPDPAVGEVRALRLGSDPAPDLEVLVAAMSPATLDLTARLGDGLSTPEIMRCLKRYVARQTYKHLPHMI